jgi:HD-GYP domain-containing protein (c-di-GMP phosphodiesterase class II)
MLPAHSRPIEHPSAVTAAAATLWTLGVPAATLIVLLAATGRHAPALVAGVVTALASLGAIGVGTRWWRTRPESQSLSFAQLMMWTWFRRARALRTLERTLQLLDGGSPVHQLQVLRELSSALETKDRYTHGHSRRVERHAIRTAIELNSAISQEEIEDLGLSAALHDVGKIEIPDSILQKEGALTPRELSIVKWHTVVGARLVAKTGNRRVAQAVLHHHESWDGTGYPHGLSGESIPLYARIIAVADAFDAMASSRPYRASLGSHRAVEVLKSESGRQFDPRVVQAFLRSFPKRASVATLIPGLGLALREVGSWARRVGLSSTAPAAGGMVVAAVVGAGMLSLPPRHAAPEPPPAADAGGQTHDTGAAVADSNQRNTAGHRSGRGTEHTPTLAAAIASQGFDSRPEALLPLAPGNSGSGGQPSSPGSKPGSDPQPSPPGETPTSPPAPQPDPDPSPDPSPPSQPADDPGGEDGDSDGSGDSGGGSEGADPAPDDGGGSAPGKGDPQPDKGKDCEKPPSSGGNSKHCGSP